MPTVSHRVTICGIPELPQHSMTGVTHVLSIIDTHEPRPEALDEFFEIDHELIRFDDVVAEYPGFEACTPQHIEKVGHVVLVGGGLGRPGLARAPVRSAGRQPEPGPVQECRVRPDLRAHAGH